MSLRPTHDNFMTDGPGSDPSESRSSLRLTVLDRHFWRCYLVLVTLVTGLIVFGLATGQYGPLWAAAVGTAAAGGTALRSRSR